MSDARDKLAGLSPEQKREMLRHLAEKAAGRAAPPPVRVDLAARHQPFPLTSLQEAYLVGRSVSGVGCHTYMELESSGVDLDRLAHTFGLLVARHDMLRARMLPSGEQRVSPTQVFDDLGCTVGIGPFCDAGQQFVFGDATRWRFRFDFMFSGFRRAIVHLFQPQLLFLSEHEFAQLFRTQFAG